MAEEVRDAAKTIPHIMMTSFYINMGLVFLTLLTMCYHIIDIPTAVDQPIGYPGIWVISQSMGQPWLNILIVVILVLEIFGELAYFAAVSRDLFAFARDHGLPFSRWLAKVDGQRQVPVNAYIFSAAVSCILALIYLGSDVTYYTVTALCTVSLLLCYMVSIGCLLWRRVFHPDTLPPARFSLGRWGIPTNIVAILFSVWCFLWNFWPQDYPVTPVDFNWASAIYILVVALAGVCYFCGGNKTYHGPVALVEGRKFRVD